MSQLIWEEPESSIIQRNRERLELFMHKSTCSSNKYKKSSSFLFLCVCTTHTVRFHTVLSNYHGIDSVKRGHADCSIC